MSKHTARAAAATAAAAFIASGRAVTVGKPGPARALSTGGKSVGGWGGQATARRSQAVHGGGGRVSTGRGCAGGA